MARPGQNLPINYEIIPISRSLRMLSESKRARVINEVVPRFVIPAINKAALMKESQRTLQRSSSVGKPVTVEGISGDLWGDGTYGMDISTPGIRVTTSNDADVRSFGDLFGG